MTDTETPAQAAAGRERGTGWRRWGLVGLTALTVHSTAVALQAQAVSYPLYTAVAAEDFAAYHARYNAAIPLVVVAPGFAGFLAAIAFWWTRPRDVPRPAAAVVTAGGAVALLSTVLWAIPRHDHLDQVGLDLETVDSLLRANLVRTTALVAASATLLWCLGRALGRRP
jgi:hypothetical protein